MQQPTTRRDSRQSLWVAAFTLAVATAGVTSTTAEAPATGGDAAELAIAGEPVLQQYRALRRMHAVSERFDHEGWMDAWTELDSEGFRYEIIRSSGDPLTANQVNTATTKTTWRMFP